MFKIIILWGFMFLSSCSSAPKYETQLTDVDLQKFMGKWYVIAGRFTPFEKEVHNGIETYEYDKAEDKIKIGFTYNKGAFDGPVKSLPQTGWVYNKTTNAHWKVSPLWPLKLDYLIVGLAPDYSWTVIGVPNQNYVWIMARDYNLNQAQLDQIIEEMKKRNYNMDDLVKVPHKY